MKTIDEAAMVDVVRAEVDRIGSLREAARRWGISPSYLSFVLRGKSRPGVSVLQAIGWERSPATYQRTKAHAEALAWLRKEEGE